MDWIKDLKVGDSIFQIEKHKDITNGFCLWNAVITKIEPNFIETSWTRDWNQEWLINLCKKLAPNHRTFSPQTTKNYFNNGNINILPSNYHNFDYRTERDNVKFAIKQAL